MAIYRKIDVHIWNDAKFNALSHHGKLTFVMLLTHPGMTALGAMRTTVEGLGAELKMEPEAFRKAFGEVLAQGLAQHDADASCVFVPNFVRYQAAESPNVIKAWAKQLEWIPECELKTRAVAGAQAFVEGYSEAFRKAFQESFSKALPNQKAVNREQRTVSINSTTRSHHDLTAPAAQSSQVIKHQATASSTKSGQVQTQGFAFFNKRFDEFWEAFGHKHGKAKAMASWVAICSAAEKAGDDLNALADRIIDAAKIEAKRRVSVVARNGTPMYPQGWLSQRRFEDEGLLAWGRFEPAEQAFVDCFNENIGDICPLVEEWTEERSVLVKAAVVGRWDLETWGRFWSHVRDTCRFDWPVSLEWLLDKKNLEKIKDGQYRKERTEA